MGSVAYREKAFSLYSALFKLIDRKFGTKWHTVYQIKLLRKKDFDEKDSEELKESISKKLSEFFENDIQKIEKYFVENWQKEQIS